MFVFCVNEKNVMEWVKKQWRRRLLSFYRLEKWVVSEAKLIERKNSWMTSLVNKKSYFIFLLIRKLLGNFTLKKE